MRLTYSRRPGSYALVLSLIGLAVIEAALIGGLIIVFAPPPLHWALLAVLAALALWVLSSALSPLVTAHRLDAEALRLRFGLTVRVDIPWVQIVGVAPVSAAPGLMTGATYTAERRELRLALSSEGLIQLELAEPLTMRVGLRSCPVERIILGLDEPNRLVAAFTGQAEMMPAPPTRVAAADPPQKPPRLRSLEAPLLVADGLSRQYGLRLAVDRLSFEVRAGEIYGFLGPNGAGKTTAIKLLVGLLIPSTGRALVAGHDVRAAPLAARAALGYVPDRALLYERLTGREYLQFLAQLRGLPLAAAETRIADLLDLLDLAPHADRLSGSYSLGMRRKLSLVAALLHRPPVLVLDEPLNGLDPLAAHRLKVLLSDLAAEGSAILLSTHDLAAAEAVASRVGLLHQGRLVAEGRPEEVRSLAAAESFEHAFLQLTVTP